MKLYLRKVHHVQANDNYRVILIFREIADRLDGKPAQAIERGDAPIERLTDNQLNATRISCAAPIFGACRSNASRAPCLRYSNWGNR